MRGILVLVLGAVLIWVGVRSGSDSHAAGESSSEDEVVRLDEDGPRDDSGEITNSNPYPEEAEADRFEPGPAITAPRVEDDPVVETHVPVPQDPPRVVEEYDEPDEAPFDLGSPGTNPQELAVILLEAWLSRDPVALEARLNDGENPLPAGQRKLLAAFWQAVVGSPQIAVDVADDLATSPHVTSAEHSLLRAAAEPDRDRPIPAASSRRDPLALAMRMILLDDRGEHALSAGTWPLASRSYSDLIHLELEAPWPPHREALEGWSEALNKAQANHRLHPDGEWPSYEIEVEHGEGLTVVRQRALREWPSLRLCVGLIREVNDVGRYLHPGQTLRLPRELPNVLVDLDARLLVYRHGTEAVGAWPVGIGKPGNDTPTGAFEVGEKTADPPWMPIGAKQLPFGHPDNPLGTRWIAWHRDGIKTSYGFHGTWEPEGVGGRVSQGCLRMRNEDVEVLFELLPVGSEILVRP